jgi:hypothetical protein
LDRVWCYFRHEITKVRHSLSPQPYRSQTGILEGFHVLGIRRVASQSCKTPCHLGSSGCETTSAHSAWLSSSQSSAEKPIVQGDHQLTPSVRTVLESVSSPAQQLQPTRGLRDHDQRPNRECAHDGIKYPFLASFLFDRGCRLAAHGTNKVRSILLR